MECRVAQMSSRAFFMPHANVQGGRPPPTETVERTNSHELRLGVEPRSGLAVGSIGFVYRHFRSETLSTILDSLQQPLAQGWINEVGAGANRHDIGLWPMSPEPFGTIEPR